MHIAIQQLYTRFSPEFYNVAEAVGERQHANSKGKAYESW